MYKLDFLEYPAGLMERIEREAQAAMLRLESKRSTSIFPRFDALMSKSAYQKAFGFVTDRDATSRYVSHADFVLCALFPEYEEACQAFYEDKGGQLRHDWDLEQALRCEQAMLCFLALAVTIHEDNPGDDAVCPVSWEGIIAFVRQMAGQAPRPIVPTPQ